MDSRPPPRHREPDEPAAQLESVVRGHSMAASLPHGTRILIRCAPVREPPVGSIVAFPGGPTLIAHRVVAHVSRPEELLLVTRGDASLLPDRPIYASAVLGLVTHRYGHDGWEPAPTTAIHRPPALRRALAAAALAMMRGAAHLRADGALAALILGAKRAAAARLRRDVAP